MSAASTLRHVLLEAATTTFEVLCYSPCEPTDTAAHVDRRAWIRFQGPRDGILELSVGDDVLKLLVEAMLGDLPAEPEDFDDALGELANVICGHVVEGLTRGGGGYALSPPRCDGAPDDGSWSASLNVALERGDATLRIRVTPAATPPAQAPN